MKEVSEQFKQSVALQVGRRSKMRITIFDPEGTDYTIDGCHGNERFSNPDAVKRAEMQCKNVGTLEPDTLKVDGSFVLAENSRDYGWFTELSDENGEFSTTQYIELSRSGGKEIKDLTIVFDDICDGLPNAINLLCTTTDGIITQLYINQCERITHIPIEQDGVTTIRIIFVGTKIPQRFVRVNNIFCNELQQFEDDTLIKANIFLETNIQAGSLPVGELNFIVDNRDFRYSVLNPNNKLSRVAIGQKVEVDIGVSDGTTKPEYVKIGTYFLSSHNDDGGGRTTSFTAQDQLRKYSGKVKCCYSNESITPIQAVQMVLNNNTSGEIPTSFPNIVYPPNTAIDNLTQEHGFTFAGLEDMPQSSALAYIAQASCACFSADASGNIVFQPFNPDRIKDEVDLSISGNIIRNYLNAKLDLPIRQVEVVVHDRSIPGRTQREHALIVELNRPATDTTITYYFEKPINAYETDRRVGTDRLLLDVWDKEGNNLNVSSSEYGNYIKELKLFNNRAEVTFVGGDATQTLRIDIQALLAVDNQYTVGFMLNNELFSSGKQKGYLLTIDNPLISSSERAYAVGEWLAKCHNLILKQEIDWLQNPALDPGDAVEIDTLYGTKHRGFVTKQEWQYIQVLNGYTTIIGEG